MKSAKAVVKVFIETDTNHVDYLLTGNHLGTGSGIWVMESQYGIDYWLLSNIN